MAVRGMERDDLLRRRIRTAFVLILICYIGLVARLVYLQGVHGPQLRREATLRRQQRIRLRAHRGSISDREGRPLAVSLYSGTIGFDPSAAIPDPHNPRAWQQRQAELASSISRAAALLRIPESNLSAAIAKAVAEYPLKHNRFLCIKTGLTLEQAEQIRSARPRLLGFGVVDSTQRVYAAGASAAHVIGFLGSGEQGLAGLELGCRSWLTGKDGYAVAEVDE